MWKYLSLNVRESEKPENAVREKDFNFSISERHKVFMMVVGSRLHYMVMLPVVHAQCLGQTSGGLLVDVNEPCCGKRCFVTLSNIFL